MPLYDCVHRVFDRRTFNFTQPVDPSPRATPTLDNWCGGASIVFSDPIAADWLNCEANWRHGFATASRAPADVACLYAGQQAIIRLATSVRLKRATI